MAYQLTTAKVWDGAAWVDAVGAEVPALTDGDISGTTGSPSVSTVGDYKIYRFTGSGSITLDKAGTCDLLVVGGGASGGRGRGGGGGAGGVLYITSAYLPAGTHTVTVGAGGTVPAIIGDAGVKGIAGGASRIADYIAPGGGGGGCWNRRANGTVEPSHGHAGGSGGGAGAGLSSSVDADGGGFGISGLGNAGGDNVQGGPGGGGGAGAAGANGTSNTGGNGGNGIANSITGSSVTYAGGGGGGGASSSGSGGTGGGGAGASNANNATDGTDSLGGGGGGVELYDYLSGAGGSGIVIVRVGV